MKQEWLSVGIDIGTTTTQVVFSRIFLESAGKYGAIQNAKVTKKEVVYTSEIYFTPLLSDGIINMRALMEIIRKEYNECGIDPKMLSTGAVIITGETARKENASEVLHQLAGMAGDFVVGTAGPDLEAILAGWGSGAGELSQRYTGTVMNFDIGGGTTNAAVFFNGEVIDAFALDIGGRLVQLNNKGIITYVSDRLIPVFDQLGLNYYPGKKADFEELKKVADRLSEMFLELAGLKDLQEDTKRLFIGHQSRGINVDRITFSGGVSEYIYYSEIVDSLEKAAIYGDIGPLLGYSIRRKMADFSEYLIEPIEKIRATVVGAGSYSIDISGSTTAFTEDVLPLKNIPILNLFSGSEEEDIHRIGEKIRIKKNLYMDETVAIAFCGPKNPKYSDIKEMAFQIVEETGKLEGPLIVIVAQDFAKALGQTIMNNLPSSRPVICLDGIKTTSGNYIDIGRPVSGVVPIVIKTLIFN